METKDTLAKTPETLGYNPLDLMYAQVAGEYANRGEQGVPSAQNSLEKILTKINVVSPSLIKTIMDKDVIGKTITNQLQEYKEHFKKQTVGDLIKYYGKSLDKYVDGGSQRVQEELNEFANMNYVKIKKEYTKATETIKDKEEGEEISKEELEKASNIIQKYQRVVLTLQKPYERLISEFENEVEENSTTDLFKKLYPVREKVE